MTKPHDVPQDVWDQATNVGGDSLWLTKSALIERRVKIARAIMAETARCAGLALEEADRKAQEADEAEGIHKDALSSMAHMAQIISLRIQTGRATE